MLVAGEASGDVLGADLARALRSRLGNGIRLIGVGGRSMAAEGIESPIEISALGVLGIFDALWIYPTVLRLAAKTAEFAANEKPDVVVLIDSWGFNLRVAHRLRRLRPAPMLIKYVAPQVWATRPGRARTLARAVDRLLAINTFDLPFFEREGLPVTFVGNPALKRDFSHVDTAALAKRLGGDDSDPTLLLLPGSRRGEVGRLLPHFEDAVDRLMSDWPRLRLMAAPAASVSDMVTGHMKQWSHNVIFLEDEPARLAGMRAATVALACSGTVTTELAMAGCPVVVAYRLGPATAVIARHLIRTRYITLFNVAAQAFVAPERVQEACTGEILARDISFLLADKPRRERQIADQFAALRTMRGGIDDPIDAAATAVIEALGPNTAGSALGA